jgi:iron complex outermembrane receptor protein
MTIMRKILPLFFLSIATVHADDIKELETMVVSEQADESSTESASPATVLTGDTLRANIGTTLGDTLKNQLGVSSQSFGAGVGSPVIRGQAGPRVQVMQNNMSNNDLSALSPDHANGVEPILAESIEVLRGPATLLYGNGAIGGIVNVKDNRIPEQLFDKVIGGAAEQRYDSATNGTASVLKLEGSQKSLSYHLDGFYRDQGNTHIGGTAIDEAAVQTNEPSFTAINNPRGVINNTQARSLGGSAGVSAISDLGLIGVSINQLDKNYGIPSDGSGNPPVNIDLKQTKYDFKAQLNKPFSFADKIKFKFGYTDYQHTEFDGSVPSTQFLNQSYSSRLELEQRPIGIVTGTIGFQSNNTQLSALNTDGSAPLIPKSNSNNYGLFALESFTLGDVKYDLGGRIESVTISAQNASHKSYFPISGSASALWKITKQHHLSLAATHSQRAPQVQELFSNGVHDATRSYELGSANLGKEFSNNLDLGYRYHGEVVTAEVNLFNNWASDYIYQQRADYLFNTNGNAFTSTSVCPTNGNCIPVQVSQQAGAVFKGYEAQLKFPMMKNHYGVLDLNVFSDYTRGTFNNGGNVPRMPPLRYGVQLSYEKNEFSSNIRVTRGEAQTHAGVNETSSPSYVLVNFGTQYHIASVANTDIMLFANAKNLLNENIRNSTSYLRNFAPEAGRSGEVGIRVSY